MNTDHAILAPSSANRWGFCSGSVMASVNAPDSASQRTREGTAAHWVGEQVLKLTAGTRKHFIPDTCAGFIGVTAPNGVVVDEEIAEGAQEWVDDVMEVSAEHGAPHGFMIEHRVEMPNIHPDNWGTLDTALWFPEVNTLYMWDYKHGHGEVRARENLQLIDYTAGLIVPLGLNAETRVVMRIVQPFCFKTSGPVDEWVTTVGELTPFFNQLTEQAHKALTNPTMTAGAHCRYCPAIARCETAKRAAYGVITYSDEPYEIATMTGADLAAERHILRTGHIIIKARLEAIEDQLRAGISNGDKSSCLTLQGKQGRLGWDIPVPDALAMGVQFGADFSKSAIITPTQAIKKVPSELRSAFKNVMTGITKRPSSGLELVPVAESRAAHAFKTRSK